MAPLAGVNPKDLASAGWGIILSRVESSRIRAALEPLLTHRQEQAGLRFRILEYKEGESKAEFLSRYGAGPGPADPDRIPYYLLIAASPTEIDFSFQYQLDIQYAVGRLYFDDLEGYRNYARTVVDWETTKHPKAKRMVVFGVENSGDTATSQLSQELMVPLAERLHDPNGGWVVESIHGENATKARLASLLGGAETPSFLFTGSHGVAFAPDAPEQRLAQGSLLCSDWVGPEPGGAPVPPEAYFSAADVDPNADLRGLVILAFGCYTAGTPLRDSFDLRSSPPYLAKTPFVAALPQRLLGKPYGALAFIGNIDRAWTFSWNMGPEGPQLGTYLSSIGGVLSGTPIGHAMEYFNQRYAELAAQMSELLRRRTDDRTEEEEVDRLWYATADAQNFVVLGDPAVSLENVRERQASVRPIAGVVSQPPTPPAVTAMPADLAKLPPSSSMQERAEGPVRLGRIAGAVNDRITELQPDLLGYGPYSKAFADLIASPHTIPPLTIGIFGDWGVGKSFLLRSIKNELNSGKFKEGNQEKVAPVLTVEFNAWEYSAHNQIWPGLVRKILDHMEKRLPGGWWQVWWSRAQRNFLRQLNKERGRLFFLLISIITGLAVAVVLAQGDFRLAAQVLVILLTGGVLKFLGELVSNPLGTWMIQIFQRNDYGEKIGLMEEIEADLRFLSSEMKDPAERILVIIDDLDRCEPDRAVEMLKAIKLLLDFDRFVVLLGIDARIVGCAIEKHYDGLMGEAGLAGSEYLDKIIQVPFQIPPATAEDLEFFISQLTENPSESISTAVGGMTGGAASQNLEALSTEQAEKPVEDDTARAKNGSDAAVVESSLAVMVQSPSSLSPKEESSPVTFPEAYEIVDLSFSYREMRVFQRLIAHTERNPRQIKRMLNIYRLVRAIAIRKQDLITLRYPEETVLWVLLCLQWPSELNLILQELEVLQREPNLGAPPQLADDPLPILFERIRTKLPESGASRDRWRRLQWLLLDSQIPRPDHIAMLRLQRYAIHTRPWLE